MMDNELNNSKTIYTFSTDISTNCLALAEYIHSYVDSGGPHTNNFIEGLYSYLNKISLEVKKLKEKSEDTLIIKLKKIANHN